MTAAGGTLMFLSIALFFVVLVMTIVAGERKPVADIPFTETVAAPATAGWLINLDQFHYWVIAAVVLIALVYGPFLFAHLPPDLAATGLQYP